MAQKIGYAAGSTDGGEWLTVWGSARRSDLVYPDREQAEERAEVLRANTVPEQRGRIIVRRVRAVYHPGVTVSQTAYRILPD